MKIQEYFGRFQTGNIVWRVSGLADLQRILRFFMEKDFRKEAEAEDGKDPASRSFCYIHFSGESLIGESLIGDTLTGEDPDDIRVCEIELNHRFETFTIAVHHAILAQPEGTVFLFDSLSDLQTAWATDLMMENFFRVITPLIREKKSRAFYPLIRSMHSAEAGEEILSDTEVFVDLYSDFQNLYLRARKIEDLPEDAEEFLPYIVKDEDGTLLRITDREVMSQFYQAAAAGTQRTSQEENRDAWERFFDSTQRKYERGLDVEEDCQRMGRIMMSRDHKIRDMLNKHFTPMDYFYVREHLVGSGLIGGKATGMLIARKIVENLRPDIFAHFEAHDSFFVGSDVFYSYIVDNKFWDLRVRQRTEEGYFEVADEFAEKLRTGVFSEKLKKQFIRVLEYYGNCPIIVRSSSILEDGFGNAFAGKYESVFCMGTGTLEERLEEFEDAIRVVYASTMSRSALDYRLRRGLANRDEQMSLLVMRVSGSFYGDYYFPCAAGVGYSYSTYRFLEELDPSAGMLRLVMGLGTSAVDRTEGSYPRLVSMDKPEATSYKSIAEHHKYSQRRVEVINTKTSQMERVDPDVLKPFLSFKKKNQLFEHDMEAERLYRNRGIRKDISFVSCPGFVKNRQMMDDMKGLMRAIQDEYGQPVDIEYAINVNDKGEYLINLLQCRPLQVFRDQNRQQVPEELKPEEMLLDCRHASMGMSLSEEVDLIVMVDPIGYYNMPYGDKVQVASCIGHLNWSMRGKDQKMLLFAPGRLGTSSPELGVPTTFADISEFTAVFEVAESRVGYNPELSYGSHMFQDLVENQILYGAVFENDKAPVYAPDKLLALPNQMEEYVPDDAHLKEIVRIYPVTGKGVKLYHDMLGERLVCTLPEEVR